VVRFGVIGTGGMGQAHCKSIEELADTRLTAVCDIDAPTAEQVGNHYGVPFFTRHKDLIRSGLCEAVLIATPHPVRPAIALDCMKAGLHVLSEKPLAEKVSAADRMVRAAARYKVALAVMFQRRTEPALAKAIEIARSGQLGRVHRASLVSPEYRSQAYYDSGGWRATWAGEGGGVLMNQAPHIIDIFVQLAGMPKAVLGRAETRLHRIEVEDVAEALLTYPGGGSGFLYCSTNEPGPGQTIEVFGDKAKLVYRDGELRLFRYKTPIAEFTRTNTAMWAKPRTVEVELKIPKAESGHHVIIRNFARHLRRGEKLIAPGHEGIASLELANAVVFSSFKKAPVTLPLRRREYDAFLAKMRAESTFKKRVKAVQRITDPQHT